MFKTPEPVGDSPELIAFCLFNLVRNSSESSVSTKDEALALYAECLATVKGSPSPNYDKLISDLENNR